MQWNSIGEFFHMGGYALYVWSSFGLTALVMLVEILQVRQARKRVLRNLSESDPSNALSSDS